MNIQELWDFGGRSLVILIGGAVLFSATAGYALASWGGFSRVAGAIAGGLGQLPGLIVLGVISAIRRGRRSAATASSAAASSTPGRPVDSGYDGFEFSDDAGGYDRGPAAASSSAASSAASVSSAAPGEYAGFGDLEEASGWGWSDDPVPVDAVALTGEPAEPWWRHLTKEAPAIAVAGIATLVLLASLLAAWLSFDAGIIPRVWFYPIGTGLDVAVIVSAIAVAVAVLAFALRPFRWSAVLLAAVADTWLVLALLTVSARHSVARVLEEVGAFTLTIGDALQALGLDTTGGTVELPPGLDLSGIGINGTTVDMSTIELGAVIPNVTIELGPGLFLLLAFAVIANVAVVLFLRAAERRERERS